MIGVFDSGVGGLAILKSFIKQLPEYDYMYFGDNKNAPFGDLTLEEIYNKTCRALDFLFLKGCDIVIIACNTVSAQALRRVQQEYLIKKYPEKKVLGIIIPTVESLMEINKSDVIGIIATKATIESKVYDIELNKLGITNKLYSKATPLLVPLIESRKTKKNEIYSYLNEIFIEFKEKKVNLLILGCTHYLLIKPLIKKTLFTNIKILDISNEVSKKLKKYLKKHGSLESKLKKNSILYLYTSLDNKKKAQELYEKYLEIDNCPKVKCV